MPGGHAASACPYTTNAAFVASQQPSAPVPAAARPPETSPQTRTTSQHRTITQPRLRRSPGALTDGYEWQRAVRVGSAKISLETEHYPPFRCWSAKRTTGPSGDRLHQRGAFRTRLGTTAGRCGARPDAPHHGTSGRADRPATADRHALLAQPISAGWET